MKNAVILCAGEGTKLWPYAQIRCKAMMPVSNKPIVAYSVDALTSMGFDNIVIVGSRFIEEIYSYFRDSKNVMVISDDKPKGTAFSLLRASAFIDGDFLALYGDTIISESDIKALVEAFTESGENTALVGKIPDRSGDRIGCEIDDGYIGSVWGHSRGESTHFFGGFAFKKSFFDVLQFNSRRFAYVEVGMMPPVEGFLEISVGDEMKRGTKIRALESSQRIFDIDKPWHILEANAEINSLRCSALKKNELAEGASIDETAAVSGFVKLGKNSVIGKNVIITGNIIVGDNSEIQNGAIVSGNVVIGDDSKVRNACFIEERSTVGNECIISHAAELDGMILDRVYLYHYMEWNGIIGENTDLGAATVCGSLRFDDSITLQNVKGRREFHTGWGDAVFLGDYCRTGVNAILMPGVKVGPYSVVGAGVILNKDVPDNTLIYTEQTLVEKKWGSEKYGW
ncbi:MAG: NTP transferase domain-containing protein [Clostridiales bacterium]|nr:NTP transferase domain-containing protein [Clostridiales bacterium]